MKRVRKEKWPVFPRNWAEYGKILRNTGMQEDTDKKTLTMDTFHAVLLNLFFLLLSSFMYDAEKWPNKLQYFQSMLGQFPVYLKVLIGKA